MNNSSSSQKLPTKEDYISPTRYAPHLSEFYPIVNRQSHDDTTKNNGTNNLPNVLSSNTPTPTPTTTTTTTSTNDILLESPRSLSQQQLKVGSRRPSSIASGMSSINDLQTLITKRDVKYTSDAMLELLKRANEFSVALSNVSNKAGLMAESMEKIAKLKGCNDDTADKLISASGLFHLLSNHEQIMSSNISNLMNDKLRDEIDEFKLKSKVLENNFKIKSKEESLKLKLQEKHNSQLSKRKIRNLISYRESLTNLQNQLDLLENIKYDYYRDSYFIVENTCNKILDEIATISRAQVELSENIARKGWSGGGLDELLLNGEDPFNKYIEEDIEEENANRQEGEEEEEEEEEEEDGSSTIQNDKNTSILHEELDSTSVRNKSMNNADENMNLIPSIEVVHADETDKNKKGHNSEPRLQEPVWIDSSSRRTLTPTSNGQTIEERTRCTECTTIQASSDPKNNNNYNSNEGDGNDKSDDDDNDDDGSHSSLFDSSFALPNSNSNTHSNSNISNIGNNNDNCNSEGNLENSSVHNLQEDIEREHKVVQMEESNEEINESTNSDTHTNNILDGLSSLEVGNN
ncbi:Ivy1p NDAI_0C04990, partial [Naumovozyma dairenensis CBS 421]